MSSCTYSLVGRPNSLASHTLQTVWLVRLVASDTAYIQHVNVGLAQACPNYTCRVEIASAIEK